MSKDFNNRIFNQKQAFSDVFFKVILEKIIAQHAKNNQGLYLFCTFWHNICWPFLFEKVHF